MKKLLFLLLFIPFLGFSQYGTWPTKYSSSDPSGAPSTNGTRLHFNTATNTLWFWEPAPSSTWRKQPKGFDQISGCAAPAYTPTARQSTFAVNTCTVLQNGQGPELYQYTGSEWECLNCITGGGTNIYAGAGITLTGSAPDITITADDSSPTNEIQTISIVGQELTLSDGGGTVTIPASGGGSDSTFANIDGTYIGKKITDNVYRSGKSGFGTVDTTAQVNIRPNNPVGSVIAYAHNYTTPLRNTFTGPTWTVQSTYKHSRIDLNNMKFNHYPSFKYGTWTEDYFIDSTTNLPLGPGNSIRNWGFNQDGAEPRLPRWYWSTEQNYYFGGVLPVWEHHLETFDTLNRQMRIVNYLGAHNGSYYGAGWRVNDFFFQKPNADGRYGLQVSLNTGLWRTDLPYSFRINNDTTVGPIMERLSAGQFRNILTWNNNRSLTVGDSNGVVITNKIRFLQSSSAPTIYAATGNLFLDSLKLTIITNDINSRYEVVKNVGNANTMEHCFDGNYYYMERNSGSSRPVLYDIRAPLYSLILAQNGDFGVGVGANGPDLAAKFRVYDNNSPTRALQMFTNSQGNKSIYAHNAPTSLSGSDGDICMTNNALYGKYLGAWDKYLLLNDANGATNGQTLTYNSGTGRWVPSAAGVSGSGTSSRVAFWSSASVLSSNTNIYIDNSNSRLGINTPSPSYSLDVVGATQAGGYILDNHPTDPLFYNKSVASPSTNFAFTQNASGQTVFNGSDVFFRVGNSTKMTAKTAGIGFGTTLPSSAVDISGATGYTQLRLRTSYTPTSTADSAGSTGDTAWDADYFYIKTAAGWKRTALSTF